MKWTVPSNLPRFGKIARGSEQHRRMAVMAAGMHPPVMARAISEFVRFLDRQGIEIGAQADRARAVALLQPTDHAGLADAAMHFAAEGGELFCNESRRALLLEAELRMSMDVMPPIDEAVVILRNPLDDHHDAPALFGSASGC
jgi:hypothetical protein